MNASTPTRRSHRGRGNPPVEETGAATHARLGDRIVVRGATNGVITREGEIVALHHPTGDPPYDLRWTDTGRVTLYFPGPDAYVRHVTPGS